MAALFFHKLNLDPARPDWPERDRFILSKGHASAILYAALARRGFFPQSDLSHGATCPVICRATLTGSRRRASR